MLQFYDIQNNVLLVIYLAVFGVKMWAMVDSIMRPTQAYLAADKQTKTAWLWINGLALASHVLLSSMFIWLIGTVAAFVYILDVKPALSAVTRRR